MSNEEKVRETCLACNQEFDSIEIVEWSGLPVCAVCLSEAEHPDNIIIFSDRATERLMNQFLAVLLI